MNRQSVIVSTNDPENRQVLLTVQTDIDLQLDSDPRRLWFGIVQDLVPVTKSCVLSGSLIDKVSIKNIRLEDGLPPGVYTWHVNDQRNQNKGLHLNVTFHPDKAVPGRFLHQLILETDLPETPEYIVNLAGELSGSLYCVPQRVLFSNFQTGIATSETVLIRTHQDIPFRIKFIESFDTEVTVILSGDESQLQHAVEVIFEPLVDRPRLQTQLKITTDLEIQPDMLLDIHGFQRREPRKLSQ